MKNNRPLDTPPQFLGIECGGTRTVALLADANGHALNRWEFGPANLRLLSDVQLVRHFRTIAKAIACPTALGIGMAGARTEADWERIRRAAAKVWPRVPCHATNDLETALAATDDKRNDTDDAGPTIRVLILSGTGSCCYGKNSAGKTAKVGGWGHILGDKGSGFEIGLRALKAMVYYYDRDGVWSALGQRILMALQLNEPNDLIGWVQTASKTKIAGLAVQVFAAWTKGDRIATDILKGAAQSLARDAFACARRLDFPASSGRRLQVSVRFILAGSVLLKQPRFAALVGKQLRKLWPGALVTPLMRESVWGAVELAREKFTVQGSKFKTERLRTSIGKQVPELVQSSRLSPTEQRNPRSMHLDKISLARAIALMLTEDARVPEALLTERKRIEQAVGLIVRTFRRGGGLFYVGAGTSGRLGVLDASECPPTFRAPPEMVQGIIAGGQTALWKSIEGAEDDRQAGARAVGFRGVNRNDVVVGIAASGRTPFVWGALGEAKRLGATTILLAFNPYLKIPRAIKPTLSIIPNLGPEVLTGSTRLKAGTATKLILNIFTTLAMVRIGKVVGNLMVDLNPSNVKLRDRAVRIVQELRKVDYATARSALEKSGWAVKSALTRLQLQPERRTSGGH